MNNPEIFVAGTLVTLIVGGALALILFGAILDGRAEQAGDTGIPVHPDMAPADDADGRPDAEPPRDAGSHEDARAGGADAPDRREPGEA